MLKLTDIFYGESKKIKHLDSLDTFDIVVEYKNGISFKIMESCEIQHSVQIPKV